MSVRSEAWKYTSARELLQGVAAEPLAGPADPDADRDAWGLGHLLAGPVAPGGAGDTVTDGGFSTARRAWGVTSGEALWVQRFRGGGVHACEDTIRVGPGAVVRHVRVVEPDASARHAGYLLVELAEGARYELVTVLAGGAVARLDVSVRLAGEGASAQLSGLTVVGGARHADHHVTVRHDAPRCTSAQDFRALCDDAATSVFTGRVVVRRGADGTDAAQLHRALLLSAAAVAKARPQLEIHTDDVKASHGTAVGALDAESMFYLRQRGLAPDEARALLVEGFAAAVLDRAPPGVAEALRADLARWRA